jgi:hypothetical protein
MLRSAEIQDIFISTTLTEYSDALVQISEETWENIVDRVKEIEVILYEPVQIAPAAPGTSGAAGDANTSHGRTERSGLAWANQREFFSFILAVQCHTIFAS